MRFAPLHVYSEYSFLQSGLTLERIISSIRKNNYFGLAITDNGVMYGIPEFVNKMDKISHPYLVGMEIHLNNNTYCLYVKNEDGYLNLIKISSKIQSEPLDESFLSEYKLLLLLIVILELLLFSTPLKVFISLYL